MRSKFFPWDFKVHRPSLIKPQESGLFVFASSAAHLERFFLERLKDQLNQQERPYQVIQGNQLTRHWIEDNLLTSSLFFAQESYIVLAADQMSKDALEALAQVHSELGERFVLLCTVDKLNAIDELAKKKEVTTFVIELPPPWEEAKLLDYLCQEMSYPLPPSLRQFILDAIEHTVENFVQTIRLLSLHCPDPAKLKPELWTSLLAPKRLDSFTWAASFAGRKKSFFKDLLELDLNNDEMAQFFRFMQTYLLKMLDDSYLEKKKAPSRFDREIKALAQGWNEVQLVQAMHLFAQLETQAKKRSPWLNSLLKRQAILSYS